MYCIILSKLLISYNWENVERVSILMVNNCDFSEPRSTENIRPGHWRAQRYHYYSTDLAMHAVGLFPGWSVEGAHRENSRGRYRGRQGESGHRIRDLVHGLCRRTIRSIINQGAQRGNWYHRVLVRQVECHWCQILLHTDTFGRK